MEEKEMPRNFKLNALKFCAYLLSLDGTTRIKKLKARRFSNFSKKNDKKKIILNKHKQNHLSIIIKETDFHICKKTMME